MNKTPLRVAFFGLALSLVLGAGFLPGGQALAADSKVTIKIGHVGAPESPQQTIGEMLAKNAAEASGGTIDIRLYGSSQLGSEKDLQQGVKSGTVDGLIAGSFVNYIKWSGVLEAPLLYRSLDHFMNVYNGPVGQELMATIEKEVGVKPLFIAPHGSFRYLTNSVRPITKPEDMKGLKIRDPSVPAYSIVCRALGAVPVPMDFAELYTALDRKMVDGQHNPMSHIVGSKFYEVQKHCSMVPYGIPPHTVSISTKAWAKLSPDQQKALMEAARKTAQEYPAVAAESNEKLRQAAVASGMAVLGPEQVDIAAFQKVFIESALPELIKAYGDEGKHYLNLILETK